MKKEKLITVVGPTASGKSAAAVAIAHAVSGEVISADSRQVYTGLDIGTGKITQTEMEGVPHHLLDVADPRTQYTVSDWVRAAQKTIEEITARGNVPIVCGGTGFYISTLLGEFTIPEVPPNTELRAELASKPAHELWDILHTLDPARAQTIEKENPVRLIRAIEIATALGSVPTHTGHTPPYDVLSIGLLPEDGDLRGRIDRRLVERIESGMVEEAQHLHRGGLSLARMHELGLEYRYLAQFLDHTLSKDEMIEKLKTEIWHYARRQKTWFKRNKTTQWFLPRDIDTIIETAKKFLV